MKSAKELIKESLGDTRLNILVFGPRPAPLSTIERTKNLQLKRIEIRKCLEDEGHYVKFAEDLVDPGLSDNSFIQELVIMPEYDLIVTLVDSPGSISEATIISIKPELAKKACLYLDRDYHEGLVANVCDLAQKLGADFKMYKYPEDLVDCNLLGFVRAKVEVVKLIKFLA